MSLFFLIVTLSLKVENISQFGEINGSSWYSFPQGMSYLFRGFRIHIFGKVPRDILHRMHSFYRFP